MSTEVELNLELKKALEEQPLHIRRHNTSAEFDALNSVSKHPLYGQFKAWFATTDLPVNAMKMLFRTYVAGHEAAQDDLLGAPEAFELVETAKDFNSRQLITEDELPEFYD